MSPYQHGEVYVLDDGSETDLDLGHYERFTNAPLTRECNYTTGKIYLSVIKKEREGSHYEGRTVQVIPHITDEIKAGIHSLATEDVDVVITEIGGTVGDIEGQPFLEAIRQFALDVGRENCLYIHLTLVPYLKAAAELKTKPTQHSVGALRTIGIQPDILICRTEHPIPPDERDKIALFCNLDRKAVIEERDKEFSIYEVPLSLVNNGLDELIVKRLGLKANPLNVDDWRELVERIKRPNSEVTIAVVGKYMKHRDAYKSVYESLDHAGIANHARVLVRRVEAEDVQRLGVENVLAGVDGLLVPGGFGMRGIEGKIEAIGYARRKKIPFFGICLGMQCAAIEFARSELGLADANSTEFDTATHNPVIALMAEQKGVRERGGTMRLGLWPCALTPGSHAQEAYGRDEIGERHRHRFEFNNDYRQRFEEAGFLPTGQSPDGSLVEIVELADHPWFLAVQFHPEFLSKPTAAHPLFRDFIAASLKRREAGRPEAEER
jgi:CTP synthase